ncbi:MAG: hypothetical protein ABIT38_06950, partial [Gemmatimonadaceae bacterium]
GAILRVCCPTSREQAGICSTSTSTLYQQALTPDMHAYVLLSWALTLTTSAFLLLTVTTSRFLLVKPTMWLLVAHILIIQWPAVFTSERIYSFLPDPWSFAVLVHGFPLIGLAGTHLTARQSAWEIWQRLPTARMGPDWSRQVLVTGVAIFVVLLYYFRVVPFSETGLYAILYNPIGAELAREESLKLVADPFVRYGYSLILAVFAPLLAGLLVSRVLDTRALQRMQALLLVALILPLLLVAVTLTGARSYAATLLVTMSLVVAFRLHFSWRLVVFFPLAMAIPAIPTILTIVREGISVDLPTFASYLQTFLIDRVFLGPLETGLWYSHFGQTIEFVGIAGIPKLAALAHLPALNMPNLVGLRYTTTAVASVHANTGFVFAYYGYFGLASFPISLLLFWGLDGVLWFVRRLGDTLLPAAVGSLAMGAIIFVTSEYTTALVTHGFALLPATAFLLDRAASFTLGSWPVRASQSVI